MVVVVFWVGGLSGGDERQGVDGAIAERQVNLVKDEGSHTPKAYILCV